MLNQIWNSWGVSVIGPLHVKTGSTNQDSWIARRYKWGNVVVVSDGLGSKNHSDHGSKVACLAVCEAAKSYQNTPNANIIDILRLIHANWLVKIAPYCAHDCSATCLFVIQIEDTITLGRLGDGIIIALGETDKKSFFLGDDKNLSFSNLTNGLQQDFKPNQWETISIKSAEYNSILLCSDGIADDLLPEKNILFAQEFYTVYADLELKKKKTDIKRWLNKWPVPGHSDDKTIACLFKKRGCK